MALTATRYTRVRIADASARCAAGDATAAWALIAAGESALARDAHGRWQGPAPGLPADPAARLGALLETCADDLTLPAGADPEAPPCIAVSSSKGDTGRWLADAPRAAAWPGSWPGVGDLLVARRLGIRLFRPAPTVAACSTGLYALLAACDALEHGLAERAVAGAGDASLQELLDAGFARLGVLCGHRRPSAFAAGGTGFAPAEGAGLLALDRTRGGPARVVAGVRAGDASHPTRCDDPAVLAAVLTALWAACPEPEAIVAHATGTAVGDRYELAGLDAGPWRSARRICCKPAIGHCLGASAAVELAIGCQAGWRRWWKLGLGFGGHIAAVAIEGR